MNDVTFTPKQVSEVVLKHMSGPSPTCEERMISEPSEWGLLKTTAITWSGWDARAHKVPPKQFWGNKNIEIKNGDVLVTKAGPRERVGVVVYVDETPSQLMVSGKMIGLRPNHQEIDYRVLAALLSSEKVQRFLDSRTTGMADSQLNFTNDLLLSTTIDVPSKEVQGKIGEIYSAMNKNIHLIEALVNKYQQIKAGLMHDLFTRGVTADGELRPTRDQEPELYQETPIGWIPKDWEPRKLKVILNQSGGYLQTGPFGSQLHAHEYTPEGVPVVMPQDINDGKIANENIARIPEARARILARHRLKEGDIIIARRGELGRAAVISGNDVGSVCGTGCFLLRLGGSSLDARFFSHAYRHDRVQRQVAGLAVGTTMPSLNNEIMGKLVFPSMPLQEQNRISDRIEAIDTKIRCFVNESQKLKKQKEGVMCDLLTGEVAVQQKKSNHV